MKDEELELVSLVVFAGVALIWLDLIWVGVFLVLDHPTRREVV